MKALRIQRFGEPDVLQIDELPDPDPGPGEVRVDVRSAALGFVDIRQREGALGGTPPFVAGFEAAGVIDRVGSGVTDYAPGDRVVAIAPGALAERVVARVANVHRIPAGVDDGAALALAVSGATAVLLAEHVPAGASTFVPAAAGSVGSVLVQLVRDNVLAGAGTEAKRQQARQLGAQAVIDTSDARWPEAVRAATAGRGADVIFVRDGASLEGSFRALAPGGKLVLFGVDLMRGAALEPGTLAALLAQNQSLVGVASFSLPATRVAAAVHRAFELGPKLRLSLDRRVGLDAVAPAHRALAARETTGTVIIELVR